MQSGFFLNLVLSFSSTSIGNRFSIIYNVYLSKIILRSEFFQDGHKAENSEDFSFLKTILDKTVVGI
jgi:hypothetical protein